ncbi:NAC domain-containing protein 78-like [Salvia miltiorrhiza]|uniref:NAC domain-containing protein 78-like n=1 Tax=Salvia miltiorrhiza TaxID=226208 RepID=UPI0025AD1288|nr:NAC domain-containing protein 78-like [Salvia miltiorrhiza]
MELKTSRKKPSSMSNMLGPGFRFHPTDEELVQYYLRRKTSGKFCRFDAITDVDVYKVEPWDLPYMSKLKTRDLEWYFFSFLDKKYGNGARTNRATEKGYWKTTGKDRPVYHKRQIVGMKKTLVYHCGRAPKGQRSNWVMHEYRLAGSELENAGAAKDAFVVCRIFQKSGSGPKNGEQYGAPFVEEEWDDDELVSVPQDDARQEIDFGDNAYLNCDDLQQILGSDVPLNITPVSSDGSHDGEATNTFGGTQNPFEFAGDGYGESKMCYDPNIQNLPAKQEGLGACSKSGNSEFADDLSLFLNEPFLDSFENFPNADEGFIEANDLSNPYETNTSTFDMLAEYLDASDDNSSLYFSSDPAMIFGNEDLASNQTLLPQMNVGNETEKAILPSGQLIDNNNFDAAFSPNKHTSTEYQSDIQYPYIKQASRMLGNIHAPPAYAAEFPSKDAIRRLNFVTRSPSSVELSASTIRIRNLNTCGKGTDQSSGKDEDFNIVLSFGFSRGDDGSSSLESSVRIVPGKADSAISRGWLCFIFFWILIFSMMSFRFGNYIGVK